MSARNLDNKRGHRDCKQLEPILENARCLWQQRVLDVGMLDAYQIGLGIFIFMDYDRGGWDVWIPTMTNSIRKTIEAIDQIRKNQEFIAAIDEPTVRNEENEAACDAAEGINKFPAMTFAEGVSSALRWVLGDDKEAPYTEG